MSSDVRENIIVEDMRPSEAIKVPGRYTTPFVTEYHPGDLGTLLSGCQLCAQLGDLGVLRKQVRA